MFELPDEHHVNTAFTALRDTVTGTEGLSRAQEYMFAVLSIEGISHTQKVAGCESFFSNMKDGAKKIWDYILNMLKGIKDFFFGGKAKEGIKEAEKKVADNKTDMGDGFNAELADDIKARQKRLKVSFDKYVNRVTGWIEKKNNLGSDKETNASKLLNGLRVEFKHSTETAGGVVKAISEGSITSGESAKNAQDKIATLLKCLASDEEMVTRHKQAFEKAVDDFETKMKATEDTLDQMVMEFELKSLQSTTAMFVGIADHIKNTTVDAVRLSGALKNLSKG